MISLTLPIPPTINHYYGQRGKIKYIKRGGRIFQHEVAVIVNQNGHTGALLHGRLWVEVVVHLHRGGDLDNRLKPLLDALQNARLFKNDSQIDDLRIIRGHPVQGGRCEVSIKRVR